ncbi:MAG: pilus assembly protein PilM, partial [Deltaproteobacteria bacterium]|nr:pilus assembly protein PilM [Deltaproteobacteria bacterium]
MPGKILGLDISKDHITAVQVTSGLKTYQITACCRVPFDDNEGMEEALQALSQQMDLKNDTCIASIPEGDVSFRNLQLPFKARKKIRQTLPFEIETVVPFPIEDLIIDFNVTDSSDRNDILAVSVRKAYISEYLAKLQTFGLDPDVLDIRSFPTVSWLLEQDGIPDNGLFLEIGLKRNSMVLFLNRRIAMIRSSVPDNGVSIQSISDDGKEEYSDSMAAEQIESCLTSFCACIKNTLHSFGWHRNSATYPEKIFYTGVGTLYPRTAELLNRFLDLPGEHINISRDRRVSMGIDIARTWKPALMDSALALALRDGRKGRGFNLRKDGFEVTRHYLGLKKNIRKMAISLILILLFIAADLGLDYHLLKKRY